MIRNSRLFKPVKNITQPTISNHLLTCDYNINDDDDLTILSSDSSNFNLLIKESSLITWKSKTRVTSSNPRVMSSKSQGTSSNLRVASSNPQVKETKSTSCKVKSTS